MAEWRGWAIRRPPRDGDGGYPYLETDTVRPTRQESHLAMLGGFEGGSWSQWRDMGYRAVRITIELPE